MRVKLKVDHEAQYSKTYNNVSWAMAVQLVCNVKGAATSCSHSHLALLRGLEVPSDVVVFWVVLYFRCGEGARRRGLGSG